MQSDLKQKFEVFALRELLTDALMEMQRVRGKVKPESDRKRFAETLDSVADQAKAFGVEVSPAEPVQAVLSANGTSA